MINRIKYDFQHQEAAFASSRLCDFKFETLRLQVRDFVISSSRLCDFKFETLRLQYGEAVFAVRRNCNRNTVKPQMQYGEAVNTVRRNGSRHCGTFPRDCLNQDFNKIYKMNRINLANPDNLVKIVVQDKSEETIILNHKNQINHSSDKSRN